MIIIKISVPTGVLVISNGEYTYAWEKKEQDLHLIQELPEWNGERR